MYSMNLNISWWSGIYFFLWVRPKVSKNNLDALLITLRTRLRVTLFVCLIICNQQRTTLCISIDTEVVKIMGQSYVMLFKLVVSSYKSCFSVFMPLVSLVFAHISLRCWNLVENLWIPSYQLHCNTCQKRQQNINSDQKKHLQFLNTMWDFWQLFAYLYVCIWQILYAKWLILYLRTCTFTLYQLLILWESNPWP